MASRALKIDPKKTAAGVSRPPAAIIPTQAPDSSAIEVRAYELWVQRGCPIGSPEVDWFRAEAEIRGNPVSAA
jgi:hypothetical protein